MKQVFIDMGRTARGPLPPEGGEAARLETPPFRGQGAGWESVYTRNGSIITKKELELFGLLTRNVYLCDIYKTTTA